MEVALGDLNGAVKFIIDGKNEQPNRLDIVEGKTSPGATQAAGTLGSAPSGFGQPSTLGQSSGFGQPSTLGQSSGFGQPSTLGQSSSGFGQPSTLGQSSGFGQPSTLGQSSGFGQPSTLGQSSGFGQPSTQGQSSGFGQPSTLGQSSGFGQPSTLGQSSGFGQPSTLGQSSGLGQPSTLGGSGFGQPSALGGQSGFGKPGFGQAAAPAAPASNPFGAPATASSPFSQISNSQPAPGGFGQPAPTNAPSPFAQTAAQQPAAPAFPPASSGFGQPQQTSGFPPPQPSAPNPFGAPSQPAATANPFGQPAAPQGVPVQHADAGPRAFLKFDDPNQLNPLPELQGETRHDPSSKRLTMWKGRPVKYVNDHPCYLHPQDNTTLVRVNFPNGPPDPASLRDSQGKPEEYTPEVAEAYEFYLNNGYFKDGIPSVPPKREWISFDF